MTLLLDYGVKINIKNNMGASPLHVTAFYCHSKCVKMLLDSEINSKTNRKETPLYFAARPFNEKSIKIFLKYGADSRIRTMEGELDEDVCSERMADLIKSYKFMNIKGAGKM